MQQPDANKFLLDALQQLKSEMVSHFDAKMDDLQTKLNKIDISLSTLGEHISELEQRVGSNEDNISDLARRISELEKDNAYLREKVEDAENRSRSNNLRFIHIPEKSEGSDTRGFIAALILQLLGPDNFSTPPAIERAHRSRMRRSEDNKDNTKPRPIVVRLLSFLDKQKILQLAREKGQLKFNDELIHIYPDYSAAVRKKRRVFDDVKKELKDRAIHYDLLYPATLKITFNGKPLHFKTPDEASAFLQNPAMIE